MKMILKKSKAEKCRNLRYKKPALMELSYFSIQNKLEEIVEICGEIHWAFDDEETLVNAFDGNEEELYEFRMIFTDVEGEAYRLSECLTETFSWNEDPEREFDDCSVALIGNRYQMVGYDAYEEDYFNLTSYETHLATTEAGKRMMRKTKAEMLSAVGQTLGIILAFQNIQYKYEYLKATIDIFRDANISVLQVIKTIEQTHADMFCDDYGKCRSAEKEFDVLVRDLPDKYWVE